MNAESRFLSKVDAWRSKDGGTWSDATPSFQMQVFEKGKLRIDLAFGHRYRYYDWASLTKIVFSTTSAMVAIEDNELKLSDSLADWIPELGPNPIFRELKLKHLLSHSAGMSWWKPFYKKLDRLGSPDHETAWPILFSEVVKDAKKRAESGELEKDRRGRAVYSDLDFFLIGEILRRGTLAGFPRRWSMIAERLELEDTCFHVDKKAHVVLPHGTRLASTIKKQTAPTEVDLRRGKSPVQGLVHDENTSSLHGVAPHAGLFGPIHDLSQYGLELRKLALGKKSRLPKSGAAFLKRSVKREQGDWAIGFMMPTKGGASCGPRFSVSSVGHTGFTGTSLWLDPARDRLVVILANRVCPTRKNTRFLELRPALHTMAIDSL